MITQQTGRNAEEQALNYLCKQGLKLKQRNYHCRAGEIDLIMQDGAYLVFVEVRSRSSMNFGGGIESVTRAKQKKIMRAATYYLMTYQLYDKLPIRFDVLSIDGSLKGSLGAVTWIKDAFGEDY